MAMIACKGCGGEVSTGAKACPKCGHVRKSAPVGKIVVLCLVGLGIVGAVGAADKRKKAKAEVESGTNAVDVTARQLYEDYKANEVSADAKYRGKVLRVSGTVKSIAKDILDDPYVTLDVSSEFGLNDVHAKFEKEGALGALRTGQQISVRCRGDNVIMGSPKLADCVLE